MVQALRVYLELLSMTFLKRRVNEGSLALKYVKMSYVYYERGTKISNKARFKKLVNKINWSRNR